MTLDLDRGMTVAGVEQRLELLVQLGQRRAVLERAMGCTIGGFQPVGRRRLDLGGLVLVTLRHGGSYDPARRTYVGWNASTSTS